MASLLNSTRVKKEEPTDAFHDSRESFPGFNVSNLHHQQKQHSQAVNTAATAGLVEQALLKPSIHEKCQSLITALESSNIKSLQHYYPIVIQKIFGFQNYTPGWQLELLHRTQSKRDADAVFSLLSPDGPLFHLIYKLMSEDVLFEFPFDILPAPAKRKMDEGLPVAELYANKISLNSTGQPIVLLNSFEFYFFIFANKMTESVTKTQSLYAEPSDWLYPQLLNNYLNHFLPMTGTLSLPPQLVVAINKSSHNTPVTPIRTTSTPLSRRSGLGLLKQTLSHTTRTGIQQSPAIADKPDKSEVWWRTERLVQIITEIWMGQTSLDLPQTKMYNTLNFDDVMSLTYTGYRRSSLVNLLCKSEYLPSHDLIMLVRIFIKHLHAFINTANNGVLPSHQQNPNTTVGALKRTLLPRYVQKSLYAFLKHSIEKWPLDTSFRPILETWLTFIRPWRYAHCSVGGNGLASTFTDDRESTVDFSIWSPFVRSYSLFYTVLFEDILTRFSRVDLTSTKMAFQLSRVTKVFNTPGLIDILRDDTAALTSSTYVYQTTYTDSMLDVTGNMLAGSQALLVNQLSDLETATFTYRPILCEDIQNMVTSLFVEAVQCQSKLHKLMKLSQEKSQANRNNSLWSFLGLGEIVEFNKSRSAQADENLQTSLKYLEQCVTELASIFKLQIPDVSSHVADSESDTALPDHQVQVDGSIKLTDLGRYQLVNGLRKFPRIEYKGDPELQPVRSYESEVGVVQLYKLSCYLNNKYQEQFEMIYKKQGLAGFIARRLLSLPSKSTQSDPVHPRISLRMLANFYFIGYTLLAYIILSSLLGRAPAVFVGILCLLLFIVLGATLDWLKSSQSEM